LFSRQRPLDSGEVGHRLARTRVDAVKKGTAGVMPGYPGAVSAANLVIEPGKRPSGRLSDQSTGLPVHAVVSGLILVQTVPPTGHVAPVSVGGLIQH
jgi:hypothetical protein